jgi:AcrR family transcriptional regulator
MVDDGGAPTPRRTQEQRRSEAERKLLRSATELIAEQGAGATSLAQIGERAGFSRGLVNHHFGSRAALFERLVRETQREFASTLDAAPSGTALDALVGFVDSYLRQIERRSPASRAFLTLWAESAGTSRELQPILAEGDRRVRAAISGLIERGVEDGSIRESCDPSAAAGAILGQLRGLGLQLAVDPALDLAGWRDDVVEGVRIAVAAQPAETAPRQQRRRTARSR